MSERDSVNDVAFIELIDRETERELDPGIRLFDGTMLETEEFINDDGGVMSPRAEQALSDLDDGWKFHRDIATVTGRIYLVDRVLKDHMTEEWGEPQVDEDGEPYFMVDDVELRSQGIVRGPHDYSFDDVPALQNRVRFGYGFSLPNDDYGLHQFVLYHGEASKHVYGTPSPEAIHLRLHRDFPEVMKLVDGLIKEGEREAGKLPKRLEVLTRRIQSELVESEHLREWLATYIDHRISFDQRWPAALTIKGPLTFIDEDGDALSLNIESPHIEHAFAPQVAFVMHSVESRPVVHAAFVANLPHPADENYTEQAIIPVTSIVSLRNTRRASSLVTVAMNAKYEYAPDEQATSIEEVVAPPARIKETMERSERLRSYQEILDELVQETRKKRQMTYSSKDAAERTSELLCNRASERLQAIGAHEMMVFLRGEAVTLPNFAVEYNANETGMSVNPHPDIPMFSPAVTGEYTGLFSGIHAAVDSFETDEGEAYLPIPTLYYAIGSMHVELFKDPVAMIEGPLTWKAGVRMNKLNSLKVAQLEQIDDFRQQKREFDAKYPRNRLGKLIEKLGRIESALALESTTGFSALRDVSALRAAGRAIDNDPGAGNEALIVLSKMFKLSTAKVIGDVYHEDRVIRDYELGGTIESFVDSVPGVPDSGAAIVMHVRQDAGQPVYYIPIKSITGFLY
jgi:hypothetical protein